MIKAHGKMREGYVLVWVLWMTIIFIGIALALLYVSASHSRKTQGSFALTRALLAAETGIERKLAVLNTSNVLGGEGLGDLSGEHRGAEFEVTTVAWWLDGEDNDSNGDVDDADEENYMTLEGIARVARVERRVRTTVLKGTMEFPDVYGAVTLYNPEDVNGDVIPGAIANFSGTPPRISGQDSALPPGIDLADLRDSDVVVGSGTGNEVVGVAVHDDQSVADILNELGNKDDRVDGVDATGMDDATLEDTLTNGGGSIGAGSVANVGGFDSRTANDIYNLAQQLGGYAAPENVYDQTNWPSGGDVIGTAASPQVTVLKPAPGTTGHLNGTVSGCGVLIIDGHVRFGGTFNYAGLVLITSRGLAEVELLGTPLVIGAIIAANPDPSMTPGMTVLDLRGTADVYYSTEALLLAEQVFTGKVQVLAQNEF